VSGDYDAIIVGGGPAGATAAVLLAQAGWRVAIIEKTPFPRRKVCGEFISETTWPLLHQLGIADALRDIAGPVVQRVGIFAGSTTVTAPLAGAQANDGGRALGREHLDTRLLQRAAMVGAEVLQPWTLAGFAKNGDHHDCRVTENGSRRTRDLRSPLIIAAHGSWESGAMPTQRLRRPAHASDLFGFKAHFLGSGLPPDLMPLLAFPGGYGGMVHSDGGRVSLSCCIRRDTLERCRQRWPHIGAGAAVRAHIEAHCLGVAHSLAAAKLDGAWLSAGPLRTGIRTFGCDGIVAVGNAAAEAHPIVAEGISIAIQSAYLLCEQLVSRRDVRLSKDVLDAVRSEYAAAWRSNFSRRLQVAALLAHLFMRPVPTRLATFALQCVPPLLTLGARWSGKIQPLQRARSPHLARGFEP
jgi:flavin-dependent dehydrogenase